MAHRLVAVGVAPRPKKLRARSLALIRCTRSLIHTLTHRGSALWPSRDEGASTTTINTPAQRKYLCVALAGGRVRARAILHRRRRTNEYASLVTSPRGAARGDYRLKTRKKDKHTRSLAFYYTPIEPPRFACQRDAPSALFVLPQGLGKGVQKDVCRREQRSSLAWRSSSYSEMSKGGKEKLNEGIKTARDRTTQHEIRIFFLRQCGKFLWSRLIL